MLAQLPWQRQIVEGLLGADRIGFQSATDAKNFMRVCGRAAERQIRAGAVLVTGQADRDS